MTNNDIARRLLTYARELEAQGGNVYRTRAYRNAAQVIERMERPLADLFAEHGRDALEALPSIGKSLAYTVEGLIQEGELKTLKPADAAREPERLFSTLPGVGPKLAEDLYDRLGLRTLDELQRAAEQGRLAEVGVGRKRLAGILAALAHRDASAVPPANEPGLEDLLAVDAHYRAAAEEGSLRRVTPRRFNPEEERWLGIHQEARSGWVLKALFSNTALAHRLEKTRDWVVIYFHKGDVHGQRTVVTETRGELAGKRVVRGRERECREHYGVGAVTSEPAA